MPRRLAPSRTTCGGSSTCSCGLKDGRSAGTRRARPTGISRKLAAFHLDKLVDRGLLTHSYACPPGRGGRGAGRSAKYYGPSDRQIDVTIPERRYDLLGSVFLRALRIAGAGRDGGGRRAPGCRGDGPGARRRTNGGVAASPPPGPERALAVTTEVLEDAGYEPYP